MIVGQGWMTRARLGAGIVIAAAMLAPPVRAQTIQGTLMEFGSDNPIDLGLIIMVSEFGDSITSTLSNGTGFFSVSSPYPGNYILMASALGYRETQVGLFELGDGGEMSVEFRLWPAPLELNGIVVQSLVQEPELVRNGYYRRMQRGVGTFLGPAEIENAPELRAQELLIGLPGVRMTIDNSGTERIEVRGTRGLCVPTVFVDGVRTAYGQVDSSLDRIAPMENLYAIEVHRGVTGIPIEFGSFNECGVIVFWTHRGRRRG